MPSNNIFDGDSLFGSNERRLIVKELAGCTTPVRADDFIHIQVEYLIRLLRKSENEAKDYKIEATQKERVVDSLYESEAQPFKSTEQQLGKFFTPIINKLIVFRDEVLIDFRKEVVSDDNKEV